MSKSVNKHSLMLVSASCLSSTANMAVVDKAMAQILAPQTSITGEIVKISQGLWDNEDTPGIKIFLKTLEKRHMLVHMGPQWVLLNQRLGLCAGDHITVSGPVIKSGNHAALIAKAVQKGHKKVILAPFWNEAQT